MSWAEDEIGRSMHALQGFRIWVQNFEFQSSISGSEHGIQGYQSAGLRVSGSGFRFSVSDLRVQIWESGSRVPDSKFRVQKFDSQFPIFEFRIWDSGSRVPDSEFRVQNFDFQFSIFGFRIWDSWSRVRAFGFRVSGSEFRISITDFQIQSLGF